MDFRQTRIAKIMSLLVLFLFIWSFTGVCDIVYAARNGTLLTQNSRKHHKIEHAGEGFQKTLDDIEHILEKTKKKKTRTERKAEKKRLMTKKFEIEEHDRELRERFKETEERIKDLPDEIKKRHRDFIKKYEENLRTLKDRLDAVERAKTDKDEEREIKKAREYLKKARPKKKHIPLDPNKLPHRTPEDKEIKLEEKKSEKRKMPKLRKLTQIYQDDLGPDENHILVASNGSLAGLLESETDLMAQNAILAQTMVPHYPKSTPPTAADLAETIDAQFTDAIKAKAAELNHHPVKIYNWVRSNVDFVPTWGSIQGADYCLQTLQCNAFDTASLLIALYRVSGIHARYVYGTKELEIDKFMNWVGNFTDPNAALSFAASGGIPIGGLTEGGKIVSAQFEHVWVKAYIDYIPSRGAKHKAGQGDTWIYLDASLKQYTYTEGMDIKTAVPFDSQTLVDQLLSTATINEEGYVTGVDSLYIKQAMDSYRIQVENHINLNHPDATVGDLLGTKEIIKHEWEILPVLPMKRTISINWIKPELPDNLRHKVSFSVTLDNILYETAPLSITRSLPELAGKKITLSYSPATQADNDVISSFLPKPHADGTPIDPSELPKSLPGYLINLQPELKIDGDTTATGGPVMMGTPEKFNIIFYDTLGVNEIVSNIVMAGEYHGIAVDTGIISDNLILKVKDRLIKTKELLEAQNHSSLTKEDLLGDMLYSTALLYFHELNTLREIHSKRSRVNSVKLPSLAMASDVNSGHQITHADSLFS